MGEAQSVGPASAALTAPRHVRLTPARTAVVLGAVTLMLTVLYIPLAWPAGDVSDGWDVLLALVAFALPRPNAAPASSRCRSVSRAKGPVAVLPGATALTVIRRAANSTAATLVTWSRKAFALE